MIQVFSREHPALTLSDVARLTGLTRATCRRILLTLEKLGHVRSDGRYFSLTPRVLTLGWAYLASLNLSELAQPLMEDLVERTKESCSAATLDPPDIVYVARVPTRRIMTIALGVGARLPAHATSMGRVLLAALPDDELERFLAETPLEPLTERTITDPDELRAAIAQVREQGGRSSTRSSRPACVGCRTDQQAAVRHDRRDQRLGCRASRLDRGVSRRGSSPRCSRRRS